MTLRESIVMYRAKHNMTQREFAAHAGISETTLVHIESGKHKAARVTEAKIKIALADETGGAQNESV